MLRIVVMVCFISLHLPFLEVFVGGYANCCEIAIVRALEDKNRAYDV